MARVRHTTESFIEAAKQVHGDTFDYSNVEFKGIRVPVEITCKRHGSFMQDPYSHLKGAGCRLDDVLPPDYYVTGGVRMHKFNFRHKHLPKVLGELYDPNESESQNMERSGFLRIWTCGLLRYVLDNGEYGKVLK